MTFGKVAGGMTKSGSRISEIPNFMLLTSPDSEDFENSMTIYEASFPESERESREFLAKSVSQLESERRSFTWAIKDSEKVIGMAHLYALAETSVIFFVYVAIQESSRGRFLIKPMMRALISEATKCCEKVGIFPRGVIFEVERIEDATSESDLRFRKKRLAFFRALGALILARCYVQPALTESKAPVPLNLMYLPFESGWNREEQIIGFYHSVFGLEANHPYVRSAIGGNC